MYQILGIKRALTLAGFLWAAVTALWFWFAPPPDHASLLQWWKLLSGSASTAALVVTLIGQSFLFPLLCRLPLVRSWLPPLDGEWNASQESNWPAIEQRSKPFATPLQLTSKKANVTIIARLFYIRMNLVSDDRYSTSKTIFVRAARDEEDGSIMLHYLYRNTTKVPVATDSDCHEGAASLMVEGKGQDIWLEGVYWTNRNWHHGLNTAGTVTLRRA